MTKRQANIIIVGIVAIILLQVLSTAATMRSLERTWRSVAIVETTAEDVLYMQKQAAGRPSPVNQTIVIHGHAVTLLPTTGEKHYTIDANGNLHEDKAPAKSLPASLGQ